MGDNILLHEHVCLVTVWVSVRGLACATAYLRVATKGWKTHAGRRPTLGSTPA